MKHSKFLTSFLLAITFALVASIGFTGCATGLPEKDRIALACNDVASAGDAIAAAAEGGLVTKADAAKARDLYHSTDKFCEPIADHLSPADYAMLASTAAKLVAQQKGIAK